MSRYTIKYKNFVVVIGWDRPLGYYHLTIGKICKNKRLQDAKIIWSNLDQPDAFPKIFTEYQDVIAKIVGIELPAEVLERLIFDKEQNTGNFEKTFEMG